MEHLLAYCAFIIVSGIITYADSIHAKANGSTVEREVVAGISICITAIICYLIGSSIFGLVGGWSFGLAGGFFGLYFSDKIVNIYMKFK